MTKRIEFSPEGLDRIMRAVQRTGLGRHFTSEEMAGYTEMADFFKLKPSTKKRLEKHLYKCARCRHYLESVRESAKAWEGPEGEKRLEAFVKRLKIAFRFTRQGMRPAVKQKKGSRVVIPITQRRRV